ncbi:MAG: glycogen debranching protein GlgX [Terriglobia bacterium]
MRRGHPLPLGTDVRRNGINFSIFSRHATAMTLVIFLRGSESPSFEIPLDPRYNRTGDVWHAFVQGLDPGIRYGYRADRAPNPAPLIHPYDPSILLMDPYAKALSGGTFWGESLHLENSSPERKVFKHRHSLVTSDVFDWADDQPLNTHLADSIIYEIHVRGFTRHPSSKVKHPGTFRGIIEKIPYLKKLGITAVELMPITEFEENDNPNHNPATGEPLKNFWGYNPISFFAPKASYASGGERKNAVQEFRTMVKALHEAGIEIILDMVFNHTAEGNEKGPTLCFRGLDNKIYYMIDPDTGRHANYSGCGNTLNCNHPVVRNLIIDSLRYWVTEMHVDGFRFDLASILGRGTDGSVLSSPPLLETIAADPVLANTKLIAEAWDAAGLYQVGTFPNWGRWAEWNGQFRDDVRRFVRGDKETIPSLATRLAGSSDLYQKDGRAPYHSINFVTSHDGFPLMDLVSFNQKQNEANGEKNADGINDNFSWNCGFEGPTRSSAINKLRKQQLKNFAALLLLSQGVPMFLGGDEMGRSQQGNNNAYCQDNDISWLNWGLLEENADLYRYFKILIAFRKKHPVLRRRSYVRPDGDLPFFLWHGIRPGQPDWSPESRLLAVQLSGGTEDNDLLIICNSGPSNLSVELAKPTRDSNWRLFLDTSLPPPREIYEKLLPLPQQVSYRVSSHSTVVLVSS